MTGFGIKSSLARDFVQNVRENFQSSSFCNYTIEVAENEEHMLKQARLIKSRAVSSVHFLSFAPMIKYEIRLPVGEIPSTQKLWNDNLVSNAFISMPFQTANFLRVQYAVERWIHKQSISFKTLTQAAPREDVFFLSAQFGFDLFTLFLVNSYLLSSNLLNCRCHYQLSF